MSLEGKLAGEVCRLRTKTKKNIPCHSLYGLRPCIQTDPAPGHASAFHRVSVFRQQGAGFGFCNAYREAMDWASENPRASEAAYQ